MNRQAAYETQTSRSLIAWGNLLIIGALVAAGLAGLTGCASTQDTYLPSPQIQPVRIGQPRSNGSHTNSSYSAPRYPRNPLGDIPADWIPPAALEIPGRWQGIMIHHTATHSGNAAQLDRMHKQRGWDGLGYHFVIDNGSGAPDGKVEVGWRWRRQREGAHCRVRAHDANYWNEHTIGIALVGNFEKKHPTDAQYRSLAKLVEFLRRRYGIPWSRIIGHGDVDRTKCPGRYFSFAELKRRVRELETRRP